MGLQARLKDAIDNIRSQGSSEQNKMVDYLLNQAQGQTADLVSGDSTSSPVHHILANVKSLLMHARVVSAPTGTLALSTVSDEGDLVGTNPYESLDVRWGKSAASWLEHLPPGTKAEFRNTPPTVTMDGAVSIAIAGDRGTGFDYRPDKVTTPAEKVAGRITALKPNYTVHLGDVYYSGTGEEETRKFIGKWPAGSNGSFTLNSASFEISMGGLAGQVRAPARRSEYLTRVEEAS